MTAEEADVIEAADDYWEMHERAKHGPVGIDEVIAAQKRILAAVSELHSANDGRWRRPTDV